MLLRDLHSPQHGSATDIRIERGGITAIGNQLYAKEGQSITFESAIVLPGLINSHDHLDFNLYPQLGSGRYNNYKEWGNDIHQQHGEIINKVRSIPQHLRVRWGLYKNLLNGVTTVVNHGEVLAPEEDIINVFERCRTIHSIGFEKRWKLKLLSPKGRARTVVIHVGEGTDKDSTREIDRLIRWNWLGRTMVGVHGVTMSEKQAKHFSGLVWCPASNDFMLGQTASIDKIKGATNIVFGTDSTLSADWNLWKHLRMARATQFATDAELLDMLTTNAAKLWQLLRSGKLETGYDADIVVAKKKESSFLASFVAIEPEDILLVMRRGEIKLFDSSVYQQMERMNIELEKFDAVTMDGSCKYVYGNLEEVIKETKKHFADAQFPVTLQNK